MHTNARQWKSWYNIYTYSTLPGHTHLSAWISISTLYWFTLCFNCCCWPWVLCSQRDLSRLLVLVHPVSIASAGQSTCKKWMVSLPKPMLNLFKVFDYYWLPSPWIFPENFMNHRRNLQSKWPVQAIGSTDVHADAILLKPRKGPSSSRHEGMNLVQKTVLWCRGQGERMPLTLPAQEDILTSLPWWCFVQRRALRKSTHAFVHESGTAIAFDLSLGANFRPDMQILEVVRRSIQ